MAIPLEHALTHAAGAVSSGTRREEIIVDLSDAGMLAGDASQLVGELCRMQNDLRGTHPDEQVTVDALLACWHEQGGQTPNAVISGRLRGKLAAEANQQQTIAHLGPSSKLDIRHFARWTADYVAPMLFALLGLATSCLTAQWSIFWHKSSSGPGSVEVDAAFLDFLHHPAAFFAVAVAAALALVAIGVAKRQRPDLASGAAFRYVRLFVAFELAGQVTFIVTLLVATPVSWIKDFGFVSPGGQ